MSPEIIDLVCPGCGAPATIGKNICEYCDREIIIRTFGTLKNMTPADTNRYQNSYKKMLMQNPDDPDIKSALAMCMLKLKLYPQAQKLFEEVVPICYDNPDIPFYAAISKLNGKKPCVAKRDELNEAIRLIEAADLIEQKGIHQYLLGVIKYDYFARKCLKTTPSWEEHLNEADTRGVSKLDIVTLNEILNFDTQDLSKI